VREGKKKLLHARKSHNKQKNQRRQPRGTKCQNQKEQNLKAALGKKNGHKKNTKANLGGGQRKDIWRDSFLIPNARGPGSEERGGGSQRKIHP